MGELSEEYVRGLVEGEGCFTFDTRYPKNKPPQKIPTFVIAMHQRDHDLLMSVRKTMRLPLINSHSIYDYGPWRKDGCNRGPTSKLIVRDYITLKEIVVPFFYGKLHGNKGKQFYEWLEKIGNDDVPSPHRLIYKFYKDGLYQKLID